MVTEVITYDVDELFGDFRWFCVFYFLYYWSVDNRFHFPWRVYVGYWCLCNDAFVVLSHYFKCADIGRFFEMNWRGRGIGKCKFVSEHTVTYIKWGVFASHKMGLVLMVPYGLVGCLGCGLDLVSLLLITKFWAAS